MTKPDIITAPFTDEQVDELNKYQVSGAFHEFTCGNENHPVGVSNVLSAMNNGWICPGCNYTQTWAHSSMANGKIINTMDKFKAKFKKP